jgi:hypothetical protein
LVRRLPRLPHAAAPIAGACACRPNTDPACVLRRFAEFHAHLVLGSAALTRGRIVSLGVWAGFLSGVGEGIAHAAARGVPTIQSPYKVSLDVLWLAPLVNAVIFGVIALVLSLVAPALRRRLGGKVDVLLVGTLVFGAVAVPAITLKVLYFPSALMLALGAAVIVTRANAPRLIAASATLSRRAIALPVLVACIALAIKGGVRLREGRVVGALPAAVAGARNVVILVLDTVRRDRFARAGQESLTPTSNGSPRRAPGTTRLVDHVVVAPLAGFDPHRPAHVHARCRLARHRDESRREHAPGIPWRTRVRHRRLLGQRRVDRSRAPGARLCAV